MTEQVKNKKIWVELANGKRTTNTFLVFTLLPYLIIRSFWEERAEIKEVFSKTSKKHKR
jgi:hypothetical protein